MRRRQGGIVLVLYTVGLIAVIGMAGFALDLGRAYLNKTRLQNAVDAAALDGAKVLFSTGSTAQATTAAQNSLNQNIAGATPAITFSSTWPFGAAGLSPKYVKVVVSSFPVTATLSAVFLGKSSFTVAGEAVAGPLPLSLGCGVPLGLCGDKNNGDKHCDGVDGCFGILPIQTLHDNQNKTTPGNFNLLQVKVNGAFSKKTSDVADALAGAGEVCANAVAGNTGLKMGGGPQNITDAVNSRFGAGGGYSSATYPPDVVTTSPLTYSAYKLALAGGVAVWDHPGGVARRRTILAPVIECTNGSNPNPLVLGTACLFLTTRVPTTNPDAGAIFVEMVSDPCISGSGTPSNDPNSTASRIVLYQSGAQS